MTPIIQATALANLLSNSNIVLVDARSGPDAIDRYKGGHLHHAVHIDLEKDLSEKQADAANGGRHPLPPVAAFTLRLGQLGIAKDTHVVVYDDKSGANAAARFWWMLRALGHEKVQVLDGGLNAGISAGIPVRTGNEDVKALTPYAAENWQLGIVNIDEVSAAAADPHQIVIDVREAYRFRGESEPIDLVAGHIPGAVNIPYTTNLDEAGIFLPADALTEKYTGALGDVTPSKVIVHCGSGVTACHTLLALEQAGIKGANLYVGSWSEWSRNPRPVATGE